MRVPWSATPPRLSLAWAPNPAVGRPLNCEPIRPRTPPPRRRRCSMPLRNRPLPSRHPPNLAAPEPPPPLPLRGSVDLLPAVVAPPFDRAPSSPHRQSAHRHADCGPSRRRRPRHHHLRRSHRPCRSRCARLRRPRPRRAPAYRDFPCRPPSPVGRCPSSIFRWVHQILSFQVSSTRGSNLFFVL